MSEGVSINQHGGQSVTQVDDEQKKLLKREMADRFKWFVEAVYGSLSKFIARFDLSASQVYRVSNAGSFPSMDYAAMISEKTGINNHWWSTGKGNWWAPTELGAKLAVKMGVDITSDNLPEVIPEGIIPEGFIPLGRLESVTPGQEMTALQVFQSMWAELVEQRRKQTEVATDVHTILEMLGEMVKK